MRYLPLFVILTFSFISVLNAQPSPGSDYADLRLITDHTTVVPGQTFMAGLHIELADGWHTYWINPGDSGIPVMIDWSESNDFTKGEVLWPYPYPFREDYLTTFGYKNESLLMVPVTVSNEISEGTYMLEASIQFLVCEKICLPGFVDVSAQITVSEGSQLSPNVAYFDKFSQKLPQANENIVANFSQNGRDVIFELQDSSSLLSSADDIIFYASEENILESSSDQNVEVVGNNLIFSFQSSRYNPNPLEIINGVLVVSHGNETKAYSIQANKTQ